MNSWNDDRLDELNRRVKGGFAEVKAGFAKVDERFEKADERFATRDEMSELRADFRILIERFDRLYYLIVVTMVGLAGSLFASNVWG